MKDAKVTNWLAKRGKFDHATPADIYVHISRQASKRTDWGELESRERRRSRNSWWWNDDAAWGLELWWTIRHQSLAARLRPYRPVAGPRPGWQRPKNLSQRQAWTVTYGQIIFTLTPFFAQCCISHRRCRRRRAAQRRAALVLLLSLTPLLKSPQNPNDLGALLHSFSLLGVLSSSNFFFASCTVMSVGRVMLFFFIHWILHDNVTVLCNAKLYLDFLFAKLLKKHFMPKERCLQ